jgi:hypothetical protein
MPVFSGSFVEINIGTEVTKIPEFAFDECGAKVVNFNAIHCGTFGYREDLCEYLSVEQINIGSEVTVYPSDFRYFKTRLLKSINAHSDNASFSSENGILFNKTKTNLIHYPDGKSETNYTVPNSVTSIGYLAFYDCRNLDSVYIGDNVVTIGNSAFNNCSNLASVSFGNNLNTIGKQAFMHCSNLASVNFGNNLNTIGDFAFVNCTNLNTIICKSTTPPAIGSYAFYDVPISAQVFIPCGTKADYLTNWDYFSNFIEEGEVDIPVNVNVIEEENCFTITWEGEYDLYEVYRNNNLLVTCSITSYTDNDLIDGTTYCYQIKSLNGECESELTDEVCQIFIYNIVCTEKWTMDNRPLTIYPNPTRGELKIVYSEFNRTDNGTLNLVQGKIKNREYSIYNSEGQLVMHGVLQYNIINVKSLSNGVYYLNFAGETVRFVKE